MQPAQRDLEVYRGDNVEIVFRLWTGTGESREPLNPAGSVFALAIRSSTGTAVVTKSTATGGGLALTSDADRTELRWSASPADTALIRAGRLGTYTLTRTDNVRGERTYLVGYVTGRQGPSGGQGDTALELTIADAEIVVAVSVDDAASANTLAVAAADATRKAFVLSLLLG